MSKNRYPSLDTCRPVQTNIIPYKMKVSRNSVEIRSLNIIKDRDEVAEWLRRWTANPLGNARVGSNPILVEFCRLCCIMANPSNYQADDPSSIPSGFEASLIHLRRYSGNFDSPKRYLFCCKVVHNVHCVVAHYAVWHIMN